ncbi:dihydrofolate reductase family protein [Herbiconiux sp. P17]|uniref:dihydrofolate reductase family protein n=1 Tax=Herbiconiux wuyangfengii TaxID=3342794 RepID=UPI0035BB95C1
MATLIYAGITSLDGYTEDASGRFDWSAPDEEVHAFVNDLERPIGTALYGRRMYEVMTFWQTVDPSAVGDDSVAMRDYAGIWQAAEKIVFSSTLAEASTPRTRIERVFDADAVRRLKEESPADLSIGGPEIAAHALRAGLVDELHLFLNPVVVGGGKSFLPPGLHLDLTLLSERRFSGGVVHVHYRVD